MLALAVTFALALPSAGAAPSPRELGLRLDLVPNLRLLAALDGNDEAGIRARQAELVSIYEKLGLAYRTGEPYRHRERCATGEHTVPAIAYQLVLPAGERAARRATLGLSERQLHDAIMHGKPLPAEAEAFVRQLPALDEARRGDLELLGRLYAARSRSDRIEAFLDVVNTWADAHLQLVRIDDEPLHEPRYELAGPVGTRWRGSARSFEFRSNMTALLSGDVLGASELERFVPLLFQHENGLRGVTETRFLAVMRKIGKVELEDLPG